MRLHTQDADTGGHLFAAGPRDDIMASEADYER